MNTDLYVFSKGKKSYVYSLENQHLYKTETVNYFTEYFYYLLYSRVTESLQNYLDSVQFERN